MDKKLLEKYDTMGMHKIYDNWPMISKESYELNQNVVDFKNIDHIVFVGMGGSGSIGDVLSSILSKTAIHLNVVKGFHLPNTVNRNTLVLANSISGNTLETLKVIQQARRKKCKTLAVSSGGKLEKYCVMHNIEFIKIDQVHSPRASFTKYLYSLLKILSGIFPIKKTDVLESIKKQQELQTKISSENLTKNNIALSLAYWMNETPMIYYPWGLHAAAIRFKNSLQENAKLHAMAEDVIETCHNGIVAWEKRSRIQPILIQGRDDYIKTKAIWRILKNYFLINNIDYKNVYSVKGGILAKLVCLIYLLDYSSIYKAILLKTDPTPVKSIDFIKKRI